MLGQFLISFIMCVLFSAMLVVRSFIGLNQITTADKIFIIVPRATSILYFAIAISEQILSFIVSS